MGKHSTIAFAALLAVGLLAPLGGALGGSNEGDGRQKGAEDLAREGVDRLMKALELMLQAMPQYEMPVINENGDIIIRRKRPTPVPKPERRPEPDDQTRT